VFTEYDIPLFSSEEGEAFLEKLLARTADELNKER
jgi:hypothetical protein